MMNTARIRELLVRLYGHEAGSSVLERLTRTLENFDVRVLSTSAGGLDQRDTILITYPDQVQHEGEPPLGVLARFCRAHFLGTITGIHILPFYPWTSDDGFSVVDYRQVDPRYGEWKDIVLLGRDFRLMFDAVINHASVESDWFQSFVAGDSKYRNYFIVPGAEEDLSKVVRPRALPLLTAFQTAEGEKKVWTTFSADQVDLNYASPDLLLEILDILLLYVSRGAEFIRLDAIAYLWKEAGTSCIHLPQTHAIIQLIRAVLEEVAPQVMLITETNVPHRDNISYFGDGTNEAHMVYNFSLPPLTLHAFHTGSAEVLSSWAAKLESPSAGVTFFNFLASHDGIGLNPLRGILSEEEIESLIQRARTHGGLVSLKNDIGGGQRPYELNINYFDALNDPNAGEPLDVQVDRFVTAHAVLLAMRGVPALYFHSLVGSRGWPEGAKESGHNRAINRRKVQEVELEELLSRPDTRSAQVLQRLLHLIRIRRTHTAFHPYGFQEVLSCPPEVFSLVRVSPDGKEKVLCLQNVSDRQVGMNTLPFIQPGMQDIITGGQIEHPVSSVLRPYQTMWLVEEED
jgi:glucosylglycerate phosphorylase